MSGKICIICGEKIRGKGLKYCSSKCRRQRTMEQYVSQNPFRSKNSSTTGAISELRVAVDLMSRGYDVFRALSSACPCDLAILKDNELLKVEVKTAYKSTSGKLYKSIKKRKVDHYAWVLNNEIIYEPELQ